MRCSFCRHDDTKVVDSRDTSENTLRRRRECLKCGKRFTTYERIETAAILVVKKDGRREPYSHDKLFAGVMHACQKLPISRDRIDRVVERIGQRLAERKGEVPSKLVGDLVMRELRSLNKVAYIRFAAVYREFGEVEDFEREVGKLLKKTKGLKR